jgi:hypothetical protein
MEVRRNDPTDRHDYVRNLDHEGRVSRTGCCLHNRENANDTAVVIKVTPSMEPGVVGWLAWYNHRAVKEKTADLIAKIIFGELDGRTGGVDGEINLREDIIHGVSPDAYVLLAYPAFCFFGLAFSLVLPMILSASHALFFLQAPSALVSLA